MPPTEPAAQTAKQPQAKPLPMIATYAYDGRRLRNHSQKSVDHLIAIGAVVGVKDKKGQLAYVQFRSSTGASPIISTAHMGQKYSFYGKVGKDSAHRAWAHKDLLDRRDVASQEERQDAERFVMGVFRNVALSCIVENSQVSEVQAKPADRSNVVSIADFQAKKRSVAPNRPIEFDSSYQLDKRAA